MDKVAAAEMIQAKALGCLDNNDRKELNEFLSLGGEFPWKEYGEYQNLTSLLPIILEIEAPDVSVKDKVAKKIYDAIAELKAKKTGGSGINKPGGELNYPDTTVLGEPILEDQTELNLSMNEGDIIPIEPEEVELPDSSVTENLSPEFSSEEPDLSLQKNDEQVLNENLPLGTPEVKKEDFPEEIINDSTVPESIPLAEEPIPSSEKQSIEEKMEDKSLNIKKTAAVQSKYRNLIEEKSKRKPLEDIPLKKEKFIEPEKPQKKSGSGIVVDIIIYILLLAAIAFVYLKLSSEIQSLKEEIDLLKQNSGILNSDSQRTLNYFC